MPGDADRQRWPSLQVVSDVVRFEREMQQQALDAIDSKAGVVLGFAGALVGLTATTSDNPWLIPGLLFALFSAICSATVLMMGKYERINPRSAWRRAKLAPEKALSDLVATEIEAIRLIGLRISGKVQWLRVAWVALATAILSTSAATVIALART